MDSIMPLIQALTSLALTLALLVGAAWGWRRFGPKLGMAMQAPTARIVVKEVRRLNPATSLYIVAIDGVEHVIASGTGQTTLLTSLSPQKKAKVAG